MSKSSDSVVPSSSSSNMSIDEDNDENSQENIWKTKLNALKGELTEFVRQGKVARALTVAKKVFDMEPTDRTDKKIQKLQALLDEENQEVDDMVDIGQGFLLFRDLQKRLYPYQLEGVKWMWWLFNKKKGGILGDDMGLGKTIQIISFLSGMFDADLLQTVLIVMPLSLIANWTKEFDKWAPGINVYQYYGTKREREQCLTRVRRRGGVLLTTYGLLVTTNEELGEQNRRLYTWDYVILDEGHKIKTSTTKTSKAAHSIPAKHRLVLSGTPLQNNLKEMWALFDFVHHGTLLGTFRTFRCEYDVPITKARAKDATPSEKKLGLEIADSLRILIQPFFLRRTKAEVLENPSSEETNGGHKVPKLVRKNELVVWLYLSDAQQKIYADFLQSDDVKQILMTKQSPLLQLTVLKKICDHPRLLSRRVCIKLGLEGEGRVDDDEDEHDEESYKFSIDHVTDNELMKESGKLLFLMELVKEIKRTGHRVLIFSQSRKMLDIIQRLISADFKFLRIDGTINNPQERQSRILKFQKDSSITVFLLTTQVGGVGLTLTGADRVIIYDPSWNPATDSQAVDRVYRIGQDKPVVVYRLITCSTVEEKIYRRQIFKDSLTRQTTGDSKNPYRYFTKEELRSLFVYEDPYTSQTQIQLEQMHSSQRISDEELDSHLAFLMSLNIFGLSHHDLMFKCAEEDEALSDPNYIGQIKMQVEKAKQMVRKDAELVERLNKEGGNLEYRQYTQENAKKRLGGGGEAPYLPPDVLAAMGLDLDNLQHYYNADEKENVQWLNKKTNPATGRKKPTAPPLSLWNEVNNTPEEILINDTPDITPSTSFNMGNDSEVVFIADSESEDETNAIGGTEHTIVDDSFPAQVIEDSFERPDDVMCDGDEEPSANPELDISLQNLSAKGWSDDWFKDVDMKIGLKEKAHKRRSVAAFDLRNTFPPIEEYFSRRRSMPFKEIANTINTNSKAWKPYSNGIANNSCILPSRPKVDDNVVEMVDISQSEKDDPKDRLSPSGRSPSATELRRSLKAFHQPSITNFLQTKPSAMDVDGESPTPKPRRRSVATPAGRRLSQLDTLQITLDSEDDHEDFKPKSTSFSKVARPVLSEDEATEVEEVSLLSSDEEGSKSLTLSPSSEPTKNFSEEDESAFSKTETASLLSAGSDSDNSAIDSFCHEKAQHSVTPTCDDSGTERFKLAKFTPLRPPKGSITSDKSSASPCFSPNPVFCAETPSSRDLQLSSSEEKSFRSVYIPNQSPYDMEDSPMAIVNRRRNTRMIIDSDSD